MKNENLNINSINALKEKASRTGGGADRRPSEEDGGRGNRALDGVGGETREDSGGRDIREGGGEKGPRGCWDEDGRPRGVSENGGGDRERRVRRDVGRDRERRVRRDRVRDGRRVRRDERRALRDRERRVRRALRDRVRRVWRDRPRDFGSSRHGGGCCGCAWSDCPASSPGPPWLLVPPPSPPI